MSKHATLLLIIVLAVSSLMMVESAFAQSAPKPSVPEFTVKFVNASYVVTTTNPYTGVDEIQQISNNSVEITINNQPFLYSNYQIYYNIRVKPSFADNWTEVYPVRNGTSSYNEDGTFSYAQYIKDAAPQSELSYTIITYPVVPTERYSASGYDIQRYYSGYNGEGRYFAFLSAIPDRGQIDFQVEALVGHYAEIFINDHPLAPWPIGHYEQAIAYDSTSSWSDAQTITVGESQTPTPSPTATPTPTPSQESQQTEQEVIIIVAIAVSGIGAGLGLLIYFKKREHQAEKVGSK